MFGKVYVQGVRGVWPKGKEKEDVRDEVLLQHKPFRHVGKVATNKGGNSVRVRV